MKHNRSSLSGGKNFSVLLYSGILIIFLCILSGACNNGKQENKESGSDTVSLKANTPQAAIRYFKKYRILKTQIDFTYSKLVFCPVFDNLASPNSMDLYFFHSRTDASCNTTISASQPAKTLTDNAGTFDNANIMVANNELLLNNFDWSNIDSIVLEPTRADVNLAFNIVAYGTGVSGPVTIPPSLPDGNQSKPSPPAPPALTPMSPKK